MERLKLTNNRKVRFGKNHYNTFSITQGLPEDGGSCVGATKGEGGCVGVCYDCTIRKLYKNYAKVEDQNFALIKDLPEEKIREILQNTVDGWLVGIKDNSKHFRLHTGGDFYNEAYARAWASVIESCPSTKFWSYTRSLFAVPILAGLKNLTLMLSCDPVNRDSVLEVYERYKDYPNVAVAWMGNVVPENFPKDRQQLVCPEVSKKLKNTDTMGACARCRACIDRPLKNGKIRHIQFPIHR